MPQRTINLEIDKAYADLKACFEAQKCKVLSEDKPNQIVVRQGSLWGASPITAKKTVIANLEPVGSTTKIACASTLGRDWKKLTVVGCIFAAVLVGVCVWIAFDLTSYMATLKPSFWSWLITIDNTADLHAGTSFVNLTEYLAVFLSLIIALEAVIYIYVQRKIDTFAEGILNSLRDKA